MPLLLVLSGKNLLKPVINKAHSSTWCTKPLSYFGNLPFKDPMALGGNKVVAQFLGQLSYISLSLILNLLYIRQMNFTRCRLKNEDMFSTQSHTPFLSPYQPEKMFKTYHLCIVSALKLKTYVTSRIFIQASKDSSSSNETPL